MRRWILLIFSALCLSATQTGCAEEDGKRGNKTSPASPDQSTAQLVPDDEVLAVLERIRKVGSLADDSAAPVLGEVDALGDRAVSLLSLLFRSEDLALRMQAKSVASRLGTRALEVLLPVLADEAHDGRYLALHILCDRLRAEEAWCVDPRLPEVLAACLRDSDEDTRQDALYCLRIVAEHQDSAVGTLIKTLGDPDDLLRSSAVSYLGSLGQRAAAAAPAIAETLSDPVEEVRSIAIESLAWIGVKSPEVIHALERSYQTESLRLRMLAAGTLFELGSVTPDVIQDVAEAIGDPQRPSRKERRISDLALLAFRELGAAGQPALSTLVKHLRSKDAVARSNALWAIASIGPAAAQAGPEVARLLSDPEPRIRRNALWAYDKIGAPDTALLIRILKSEDEWMREGAVCSLARKGEDARAAVPDLLQMADRDKPKIRVSAAWAIWCIEGDPTLPVLRLTEILGDRRMLLQARIEAARALGEIGPRAKDARRVLREVLDATWDYPTFHILYRDKRVRILCAAAVAHYRVCGEAEPGLGLLLKMLEDSELTTRDRFWVACAIGYFGRDGTRALDALERAGKEEDDSLRRAVAEAIKFIREGAMPPSGKSDEGTGPGD